METRTRASVDVGKDQETKLDRVVAENLILDCFLLRSNKKILPFISYEPNDFRGYEEKDFFNFTINLEISLHHFLMLLHVRSSKLSVKYFR